MGGPTDLISGELRLVARFKASGGKLQAEYGWTKSPVLGLAEVSCLT